MLAALCRSRRCTGWCTVRGAAASSGTVDIVVGVRAGAGGAGALRVADPRGGAVDAHGGTGLLQVSGPEAAVLPVARVGVGAGVLVVGGVVAALLETLQPPLPLQTELHWHWVGVQV